MNAFEVNASQEEIEYSRAVHVEEYKYQLKDKDQDIAFKEHCSRRRMKH